MFKRIFLLFVTILLSLSAQEKKTIQAVKIDSEILIDGKLDEPVWQTLTTLKDFLQFEPSNGKPASQKSEALVCYDDNALYVGVILYDTAPDSILMELSSRDNDDVLADLIAVHICPYDDGINSLFFGVMSTGVQMDMKLSADGDDYNWDAVWESEISLTDQGWIAEFKIPYSALRFPDKDVQEWGFNIIRRLRRLDEWSTWSYISKENNQWWHDYGMLKDIKNINSPLRLSFTPYVSTYFENKKSGDWATNFNGGMDLKYGISESFTLDMTLIPDFGQVQSDDEELNLSPYEIKYNEKRQFFTEGTELFNRAGIFYSRRIGSSPVWSGNVEDELNETEVIHENPIETKMINATKISGRTDFGLGIGMLNAMTQSSSAIVRDTLTGIEREIETQPFANYNVLVFDQTFFNNSFVSIINTNVAMKDYISNVSATELRLMDATNQFGVKANAAISYKKNKGDKSDGYKYSIEAGKFGGKFRFNYALSLVNDSYDHNDLGYLQKNNFVSQDFIVRYYVFEPTWIFREFSNHLGLNISRQYNPDVFSQFRFDYEINTWLTNNYIINMHAAWVPIEGRDYYEPRIEGRYFKSHKMFHNCFNFRTDNREKATLWGGAGFTTAYDYEFDTYNLWYDINPTYRFSDKFTLEYDFYFSVTNNEAGYVDSEGENDPIYFGVRNRETLTNTLFASYKFDNKSSVTFRLRHYWSKADYDSYYELLDNGELISSNYNENNNVNYNAFNIDMTYRWFFAPGSELVLNWKNSIYTEEENPEDDYWNNFKNTIESPQTNSISLKILYYLDYTKIF